MTDMLQLGEDNMDILIINALQIGRASCRERV